MVQCATRRRDERSSFAGQTLRPVPAVMPVPGRSSGPEKLGGSHGGATSSAVIVTSLGCGAERCSLLLGPVAIAGG